MHRALLSLHLLGAAVWVGGHLTLALSVLPRALRTREIGPLREFEERFEKVGIPALALQILTGLWLARLYVPDPGRWFAFADPMGTAAGVKLILLAATAALAAHARLRLIPRLDGGNLPLLAAHILAVTAIAVLFVLVGVGFRFGGFP